MVEPELAAQHGSHLPRNHPRVLRADQAQILASDLAEVLGVVQRPRQKTLVVLEPAFHAVFCEARTLLPGHQFGALQDGGVVKTLNIPFAERLPRRVVALVAVRMPHRDGLVVQAVVQRFAKRQDVFDFHLVGK